MKISPLVGSSSPPIIRNSVLFPQPDGPSSTMNSRSGMSRLTSSTACTGSPPLVGNALVTASNRTPATARTLHAYPRDSMDIDPGQPSAPSTALDLDAIAADLDGVEVALARLDDGSYWTDEVTGDALPDELLAESPTARQA